MYTKASVVLIVFLAVLSNSVIAQQSERYSGYAIKNVPTNLNLSIDQIVNVDCRDCKTVLEVLAVALNGTGYSLSSPSDSDPDISYIYNRAINADRVTGSFVLSELLQAIAGSGWKLKVNEVKSTVTWVKQ